MRKFKGIAILSRYLFVEMLQPMIFCSLAFTVMLMSSVLYEMTDLIINKRIPVLTVVQILIYRLPNIFVLALPVSSLFATIYTLGRLVKDNEITAMRISGFGIHRIIFPFLLLGLVITAGNYWLNEQIVPWADHRSMNLIRQMIIKDVTPNVKENIFFQGPDNRYFYVRKVDRQSGVLHDVVIYETQFDGGNETSFPRVISAKQGRFFEEFWELEGGVIHEFDNLGFIEKEMLFERLSIPVNDGLENFFGNQKTAGEMSRDELLEEIELFARSGIKVDSWEVEYHLKLAIPFAPLIFILVGAPLSLRNRRGWAIGIVMTIVVAFGYYVTQSVFKSLGTGGLIAPFWAAWVPNMIFGALGLFLILYEEFIW